MGDCQGVHFIIFAVKQFERQDFFFSGGARVTQDLGDGGDAIAGENAEAIVDLGAGWFSGIIVQVEHWERVAGSVSNFLSEALLTIPQ